MANDQLQQSPAQDEFTVCNSDLVQVPYSTVLKAIELTGSDPFTMTIRCSIEWAAKGIESKVRSAPYV
mgnify:CR=1 FL=1